LLLRPQLCCIGKQPPGALILERGIVGIVHDITTPHEPEGCRLDQRPAEIALAMAGLLVAKLELLKLQGDQEMATITAQM
jgi:hypothetical protein